MTKFIDFVNFEVQKSAQFIIIVALIFPVTVLIQQIFNFRLINFCPIGPMGNAMRAVPTHPMGYFHWESHAKPIPMDKPVNLFINVCHHMIFHSISHDALMLN